MLLQNQTNFLYQIKFKVSNIFQIFKIKFQNISNILAKFSFFAIIKTHSSKPAYFNVLYNIIYNIESSLSFHSFLVNISHFSFTNYQTFYRMELSNFLGTILSNFPIFI